MIPGPGLLSKGQLPLGRLTVVGLRAICVALVLALLSLYSAFWQMTDWRSLSESRRPEASKLLGALATEDGSLEISPGGIRSRKNTGEAVKVRVTWKVKAEDSPEISIYVTNPAGERKLWLTGGSAGSDETGPWVFAGTRFEMVDKSTGKEISSLRFSAHPYAD
jgi:hypothetical protein